LLKDVNCWQGYYNYHMPLINCPDCRKEISDSAISCPSCGFNLLKQSTVRKSKEAASFFMVATGGAIGMSLAFIATLVLYVYRLIRLPFYLLGFLFMKLTGSDGPRVVPPKRSSFKNNDFDNWS
jgi:hypothetical protein